MTDLSFCQSRICISVKSTLNDLQNNLTVISYITHSTSSYYCCYIIVCKPPIIFANNISNCSTVTVFINVNLINLSYKCYYYIKVFSLLGIFYSIS